MTPAARELVHMIFESLFQLPQSGGGVLVQAGHFSLFRWKESACCIPGVFHEIRGDSTARRRIREVIGAFPLATWMLGVAIVKELRASGTHSSLITVVNDWQHVASGVPGGARAVRESFYRSAAPTLSVYARVLRCTGLASSLRTGIGRNGALVSENWLRHRVARHLAKLQRDEDGEGALLRWEREPSGRSCLKYFGESEPSTVLRYNHGDCAGEISELVSEAHRLGYRALLNFFPTECAGPVVSGTERGLTIFGIDGLTVLNVGLSCAGERSLAGILDKGGVLYTSCLTGTQCRTWHASPTPSSAPTPIQ